MNLSQHIILISGEAWSRLKDDIEEIKKRGELILMIGDMNRAIGADKLGIPGNKELVSVGGQLIREEMLKDGEFILLNNQAKTEGGPWTWVQAGKEEVKSCLDLAIESAELLPFAKKLVIDSKREFTPRRVMRRKTGVVSVYSDHYSMQVVLQGLPGKEGRVERKAVWNLGKPGGWKRYEKQTELVAAKIEQILMKEGKSEEVMEKVEAIEEKVKFKAFGKTKPQTRKKLEGKNKLKDEELLRKQAMAIEEEIRKVKAETKGKVGRVYAMKKIVNGSKNEAQEPVAIKDPSTNQLVVSPEEIKKVTLKYCVDNLRKNERDEKGKREDDIKQKVHEIRMKEKKEEEEDCEFEEEDFATVLRKFQSKSSKSYDFLLKASNKYKEAIFHLCKRFCDEEDFPKRMQKTTLQMIWKKKGSQAELKNNCFKHLKDYLARTCEALVVGKMKEKVFESASVYQIGGQKQHCIEEHIFGIKSLISLVEQQGRGLILTLVDIIAFFDKED